MKQFTMSNCKYGAPMGRASYGTPETPAKLFKVNLDSGGYDDGAAYWGHGGGYLYCLETSPVWQEDIKMDTEESRHFYRAYSRQEAFQMALEQFPELKLKRANMLTTIDLCAALSGLLQGAYNRLALFQAIKHENATASDRAMLKRFLYCRATEADKVLLQEFINQLRSA